jgi:glycosyltransferase involved in cell wall biosynthesis
MRTAMRALIIDPALHSMGGHHYNATLALKAKLGALGIDHDCLGSAYADEQAIRELGCAPCFTRSVYGRLYDKPEEFERQVRTTLDELSRALERRPRADLLVMPCCDQVLAFALARYLRFRRAPHLLLWALYAPHHNKAFDDPSTISLRGETREAFAALQRVVGLQRISAFCETAEMANFYRDVASLDVDVAPGPGLVGGRRTSTRSGPPVVGCIGFANEAKGYRLLPAAVRDVLADDPAVRFMIHGIFQGSDAPDQGAVFEALAALDSRVSVNTEILSHAAYLDWLSRIDLVLLPYDPAVYRTRGSGVFFEARRLGIPVVATKGCGFAQAAFDDGSGAEIGQRTAAGVADAIRRALRRLDEMTRRAAPAAHSDNDVDGILDAVVGTIVSGRGRLGRSGR